MICEPCRNAADQHVSALHGECIGNGCDCQHQPTQAEIDRLTVGDVPRPNRWASYGKCPKCSAPAGEPCVNLSWHHWQKDTRNPHAERKRKGK